MAELLRHSLNLRLYHGPVSQHNNEVELPLRTIDGIREAYQPIWYWFRPEVLNLQCPDLDMVKRGHEVCCDLSRLLLGDGVCAGFMSSPGAGRVIPRTVARVWGVKLVTP